MKYYKLKNDIPMFKKGDLFFIHPEEYKRWRAGNNGKYWYLDGYGSVDYCYEGIGDEEDNSYDIGNYFRTEEEAEVYKEYLLARQVLLDDAEGGKWIEDSKNWHAFYDTTSETYAIASGMSYYFPGVVCFKNGGSLYKSLKEHKDQWEIVRKYEMGEM